MLSAKSLMNSTKLKKDKKIKPKLEKKLVKLINDSDSGSESEHELSYYLNDKVKLMKEVIHILKPKKIKNMAPSCIKHLSIEEINSMLLEELLGISNKRLRKIFNGEPQDDDSSSTEEEEEKPADVISLDDVTDDDFVIDLDSDNEATKSKKKKKGRIKNEPKEKKIKKEKNEKNTVHKKDHGIIDAASEEHLMSVLELLELQARARAIRSQLALENSKKAKEKAQEEEKGKAVGNSDVEDAIIIESPKNEEIVITSSDSEVDGSNSRSHEMNTTNIEIIDMSNETSKNELTTSQSKPNRIDVAMENPEEMNKLLNKLHKLKKQKRKFDKQTCKLNRQESEKKDVMNTEDKSTIPEKYVDTNNVLSLEHASTSKYVDITSIDQTCVDEDDSIVLNVDQAEIDSINEEPESSEAKDHELTSTVDNEVKVAEKLHDISDSSISNTKISSDAEDCHEHTKDSNSSWVKKHVNEEGDGIILNIDQLEMESINIDLS